MNWKLNSDKNQPRRTLGTGPDTDNSDGTVLGKQFCLTVRSAAM